MTRDSASCFQGQAAVPMTRLVLAIFLSSVGAVLFSLSIFRLLQFFVMPSMFFALLLVGFPIGAAVAARWPRSDVARFARMLTVLKLVMLASIAATLLCKHVDYMRANLLFGIDPVQLFVQVLAFALIYLPFFAAYGAAEYVGYLAGTAAFSQRMRPVYGLFLFGGAAAFGLAEFLQRPLGVPRLLVIAVAAVLVSRFLLTDGARLRRGLELGLLVAVACWPGFDRTFMDLFKLPAEVRQSVAAHREKFRDTEVLHAAWGKYSYVEILRSSREAYIDFFSGFYNDVAMWAVTPRTESDPIRTQLQRLATNDWVPHLFIPENGKVALIGSGGGRGIYHARLANASRILALEIEPEVVEAIQGPLREPFKDVYNAPPVEAYVGEARSWLEASDERFDLIMLMSVGGYPQLMLEPGNMIRTIEAFQVFVDHLTPTGIITIGYDRMLDKKGILLSQYYYTLDRLGMTCYGFQLEQGYLLLAFPADAPPAQQAAWEAARAELARGATHVSGPDLEFPDYRPITDDRPFLAGNISNILSVANIRWMFAVMSFVILLTALFASLLLARPLRLQPMPVSRPTLMAISFLVGANFMLMEHLTVVQLFVHLYAYYDALIIGIIAFLTLTGLGSLLIARRALVPVIGATLLLLMGWWWAAPDGVWATLLVIPGILATGAFFPLIFEQIPAGRLQLFGLDAVGAALGATLAFFVPMLYGFAAFSTVAVAVFALTGICMLLFIGRLRDS